MAPHSFPTQLILAICILELMGARLGVNSTFLMKLEPEIGSTKVQYKSHASLVVLGGGRGQALCLLV